MEKRTIIEHRAKTKEYLIALFINTNFVKLLNDKNKPYQKVCQWLIDNEEKVKVLHYVPTVKEVSQSTQLRVEKVTQFLKDIYNDILLLNENEPEKFGDQGDIICNLHLTYLNSFAYFSVCLKQIPRVGDQFDFNFIIPKIGGNYFFVNRVYHEFENNRHTVTIILSNDEPFLYIELLKQKEYLRKWISFDEFIQPMTDSLKSKLLKGGL
jgi:hypothetical protein